MVAERAPLLTGCELITLPRHGSQAALYQLLLLPSAEPFWLGRQSYMCRGILALETTFLHMHHFLPRAAKPLGTSAAAARGQHVTKGRP